MWYNVITVKGQRVPKIKKEVDIMLLFNNPTDKESAINVRNNVFYDYYANGTVHYVENYAINGLSFTEYILVKNDRPCKFLLCDGTVVAYQHYKFVDRG